MTCKLIRSNIIGTALAILALLAGATPAEVAAQQHTRGTSGDAGQNHGDGTSDGTSDSNAPYAGQQNRAIKSLSSKDIAELKAGRGWGMAKAAELNGVPGPAHLLELRKELGLNPVQIEQIEQLFEGMQRKAKRLGEEFIELELRLNDNFAHGTINEATLRGWLDEIGKVRVALRFTHLVTHLRTSPILTSQQAERYNELRGYAKRPRN